jgi:hypothetical protein
MSPKYNIFRKNSVQYGSIEDWECLRCFKIVPSSGIDPFNQDTCVCANAGSFAQDYDRPQNKEPLDRGYQYQDPRISTIHLPLQSYASSSASAPCPEGPEREVPDATATNGQAQVVMDAALNDPQYGLSRSAPPGVSLPMWRFLVEPDRNRPAYAAEPASASAGMLGGDFHIHSKKRESSNRRRKASHQSILSSSSDEHSFPGCDVDPIAWIGSWDEKESYAYSGDQYPTTMSGLVENPAEQ